MHCDGTCSNIMAAAAAAAEVRMQAKSQNNCRLEKEF